MTEGRAEGAADHDLRPTIELVRLMAVEDDAVPRAVAAAAPAVAAAIDAIVERLERGGRLVYAGAGSSGRIAALDASECESTFSTAPGQVVAIVAGDGLASAAERDAAEDDADAGAPRSKPSASPRPTRVVAISASGRTPFALGTLRAARAAGALTVALVSVPASELAALADHEIAVVVGPEFLAGSTRLKAGTAQKLVLNQISTIAMIRLGKTYGDLMVDVTGTNEKLRARSRRAVLLATGASEDEVDGALADADGQRQGRDRHAARRRGRARGAHPARARGRPRARGAGVRLGVEAALVDGLLVPGDVEIADGAVTGIGLASRNGRSRGIASPGFVDLQVNGFGGVDLLATDAEGYRLAGEALLETGVTVVPPDLHHRARGRRSSRRSRRCRRTRTAGRASSASHVEGPFLSPTRVGHAPARLAARPRPGAARADRSPRGRSCS